MEEADGKSFRFKSQNYMDDSRVSEVDGQADAPGQGRGQAQQAERQEVRRRHVVFRRAHALVDRGGARRSDAARVSVYDGSESGEKIYQSLSVIGKRIEPDKKLDDAAAGRMCSPVSRAGR